MSDFTIEIYQQCNSPTTGNVGGYSQWGLNDERQYPQCSCPAYKYGKRNVSFHGKMYPKPCKHIIALETTICDWHEYYSPESQTKEGVCPKCGGPTIPVKVAV